MNPTKTETFSVRWEKRFARELRELARRLKKTPVQLMVEALRDRLPHFEDQATREPDEPPDPPPSRIIATRRRRGPYRRN